jgi:hypothetical protein
MGNYDIFFAKYSQTVGIDEYEAEKPMVFTIYPNPAEDVFFVDNKSSLVKIESQFIIVEIYNIYGELIKRKQCNYGEPINILSLIHGVYMVKIKTHSCFSANREWTEVKKLVKM